jgi:hypothetical protein
MKIPIKQPNTLQLFIDKLVAPNFKLPTLNEDGLLVNRYHNCWQRLSLFTAIFRKIATNFITGTIELAFFSLKLAIPSIKKTLAILMFLLPGFLFGQKINTGSIKGRVLDKDKKQAIAGAVIVLTNTQTSTMADSSGFFEIGSILPGSYTIETRQLGYEDRLVQNISVYEGKVTYREIEMQESVEPVKEVTVRAFRYENNRMTPVSSYSFSREEIALNPGSQGDIFRAIGMLPGVSSSGGIYSAISVRGQGVRDNVYMVDDIPVTEVGHLEGNSFFNDPNGGRFSVFAPRVIDNAQFQGGVFGPEYGRRSASYLGMAIKEGNKESAFIDGQVDLLGVTLNYDGPSPLIKNTSLFVSARYQNFYGLVNLIGLKDIGLPIYGDLIVKTTTQINSKNKISLLAMICPESYVRDIDNVYADKKLNLLYLPDFKRNKIITGIHLTTNTGKKSYWKNVLYYTNYSSNVQVGKAYPISDTNGNLIKPVIDYTTNLQTQEYAENKIGYRSIYNHTINKNNKLDFGIEADYLALSNERILTGNDTNFVFRKYQISDTNLRYQPIYPGMVNASYKAGNYNVSCFFNYSMVIKKIILNAGIRYDYTGFSQQQVISPRFSGSYNVNSKNSINFGCGLYFQDPVYADIADQPTNHLLKMEKVIQYIVGYRHYFSPDLKFTLELWYKDFNNLVMTPINGTVFKTNTGSGWGNGIDINLTKRLTKHFHGQVGYSFIDCKRDDHDGIGQYNFMYSQPHQFNLLTSYTLNKKWSFALKYRYATGKPKDNYVVFANVLNNSGYWRYSQELIGRNANRLPDFSSLDVRLNYNFSFKSAKLTIFMDVVNLLNKQIANGENFNSITGKTYYDGLAIFPTGGLKFEF